MRFLYDYIEDTLNSINDIKKLERFLEYCIAYLNHDLREFEDEEETSKRPNFENSAYTSLI
jgi:hypothetical protein